MEFTGEDISKLVEEKKELLDMIENFMGLIDTPVGRFKLKGEFPDECRKLGQEILIKHGRKREFN